MLIINLLILLEHKNTVPNDMIFSLVRRSVRFALISVCLKLINKLIVISGHEERS